jgi:hypothetical protein
LKVLRKPENEAEANAIQLVLKKHGIHAKVKSFYDTAYDGLYQARYGWGVIEVEDSDLHEAKKIVEEWERASPEELPWNDKSTES